MRNVLGMGELGRQIWTPGPKHYLFPRCETCGKEVDGIEIVDQGEKNGLRYWVVLGTCHGKQDAVRVDFHHTPTDDIVYMVMRDMSFFPREHVDSGHSR